MSAVSQKECDFILLKVFMKNGSIGGASRVWLLVCSVFLAGCDNAPQPSAPAPVKEQKTMTKTVIDGLTGKAAVDQGKAARETLHAVDEQRRKELESLNP